MAGYKITAYDAAGVEVKSLEVDSDEDGPEFYAHQLLHADAITHVQVYDADTRELLLERSDPVEAGNGDLG